MLIVCVNLSSLLFARTMARQKEMAVRIALGASHGRLIRQMLTESVTLSGCGAIIGLMLALAGTRWLAHLHTFSIPLLENVPVDLNVFGFTLLLSVLNSITFGTIPAFSGPQSCPARIPEEYQSRFCRQ